MSEQRIETSLETRISFLEGYTLGLESAIKSLKEEITILEMPCNHQTDAPEFVPAIEEAKKISDIQRLHDLIDRLRGRLVDNEIICEQNTQHIQSLQRIFDANFLKLVKSMSILQVCAFIMAILGIAATSVAIIWYLLRDFLVALMSYG